MSKFLTYEQRLEIQKGLKEHSSFGRIGEAIHKDRTTVAKEIKKYSCEQKTGCDRLDTCTLKKCFYHADDAHIRCREHLSECRTGILSNELELGRLFPAQDTCFLLRSLLSPPERRHRGQPRAGQEDPSQGKFL